MTSHICFLIFGISYEEVVTAAYPKHWGEGCDCARLGLLAAFSRPLHG